MAAKGYGTEIINAIKVIYSSPRMRLNALQMHINVNFDDLVRSPKDISFEVLAYADDLAIICRNKAELDSVIERLEKWAVDNEIAVNKRKVEF